MSKIVLYPANGFDFDAADVAAYLAGRTSGVFSSAEDFPVTAAGGLTVTVGAGRGWVHPSRFTGYSITKRGRHPGPAAGRPVSPPHRSNRHAL